MLMRGEMLMRGAVLHNRPGQAKTNTPLKIPYKELTHSCIKKTPLPEIPYQSIPAGSAQDPTQPLEHTPQSPQEWHWAG